MSYGSTKWETIIWYHYNCRVYNSYRFGRFANFFSKNYGSDMKDRQKKSCLSFRKTLPRIVIKSFLNFISYSIFWFQTQKSRYLRFFFTSPSCYFFFPRFIFLSFRYFLTVKGTPLLIDTTESMSFTSLFLKKRLFFRLSLIGSVLSFSWEYSLKKSGTLDRGV